MPGSRLVAFAAAAASCAAGILLGPPARAVPIVAGDQGTPCWGEQVAVNASPTQGGSGNSAVLLTFSLVGGEPCTLTGYPSVDSGKGGPALHAEPIPSIDAPPSVILSVSTAAQAVVEGTAVDASGTPCSSYSDLRVSPPAINLVFTVPATIEACQLQVHPLTAA